MTADRRPPTAGSRTRPDYALLAFVAALVVIGLQLVYSATFAMAITEHADVTHFLVRQALWAAIGGVLLLLLSRLDYHIFRPLAPVILGTALVTLILVLIPQFNVSQYGASRWLRLGPLPPIQPSEFVKLAVVIGLAAWLADPAHRPGHLREGLLPPCIFLCVLAAIIMQQPDLGTTIVIVLTASTVLFLAGIDVRTLLMLCVMAAGAGFALIATASYRLDRWKSFLDPWKDPDGAGFHIIQLMIALGSGGIFGLGIGESRQKFFYVPGAHTDGIFAILGEEAGFIGCLLVLLLYAGMVYRGIRIVQQAKDPFGQFLAAGIVSWIAYQTLINLGGITGAVPLTGIPLPFLSYGGSSLAATLVAIGILLNVARQGRPDATPKAVTSRQSPVARLIAHVGRGLVPRLPRRGAR